MKIKELRNPPITEALLEIRFNTNKEVTISKLQEFAESLSEIYPKMESIANQSIQFAVSHDSPTKHNFNIQPVGFRLTNAEGNRVVIAEIDKLTVSFLTPYASWPSLKDITNDLYIKYIKLVPQSEITRLGMRFINTLKWPLDEEFDFDDYLITNQPLPKYEGLPNRLLNFETFLVLPLENGCKSTIRQVLLDIEKDQSKNIVTLPFVLDIDVFKQDTYEISSNKIWGVFDEMKDKKNAIFFGTFTDKALAQYE